MNLIAAIRKVEDQYGSVMNAPPEAMEEIYKIVNSQIVTDYASYKSEVVNEVLTELDTAEMSTLEITNVINARLEAGYSTNRKVVLYHLRKRGLPFKKQVGSLPNEKGRRVNKKR